MTYQADVSKTSAFLETVIKKRLDEKELDWFLQQEDKLSNNFKLPSLYLAFSSVPRFIKKDSLQITQEERVRAEDLRTGFQPEQWNLVQAVRVYFLLMLPKEDSKSYEENIVRLFETADMDEQVALYSALPLLPFPEKMSKRATEGIRTNITDVFDAIALHNPFPKDFLEKDPWNQMVLKAVFMQRPLYRIYGADERANPELARMLVDFAHERWAASRKVWPELWRFVGPFINDDSIADLKKVVSGDHLEREAGLLACALAKHAKAQELVDQYPEIKKEIEKGTLNWEVLGKKAEAEF